MRATRDLSAILEALAAAARIGERRREGNDVQQVGKGADLERRIESFFQLHGYQTFRNVFREGKSGGRHELDVLATKADDVTEFTVLVECKAWSTPIEKEIVSKISFVKTDLGINKAIIVSLRSSTVGAELAAKELGIELWGTEEIRDKLGQVAVAELDLGTAARRGKGFALAVMEPQARPTLLGMARGVLGFGSEEVTWLKLLWLPFYLLEMDHATTRSAFLKGQYTDTRTRWNLHEALTGRIVCSFDVLPHLEEVQLTLSIPPRWKPKKLERDINEAARKLRSVSTERAQTRHSQRLSELGVPSDADATTITRNELVFLPAYVALLRSGGRKRLVAFDGVRGNTYPILDGALTETVAYVEEAVEREVGSPMEVLVPAATPNYLALIALVLAAVGSLYWVGLQAQWWSDPLNMLGIVAVVLGGIWLVSKRK